MRKFNDERIQQTASYLGIAYPVKTPNIYILESDIV